VDFAIRDRKPDAWIFYVVCDVSGSMHAERPDGSITPWQVIYDGLGDILFEIHESPTARDIAHMSILAFGDRVEEVLPLTSLRDDVYIPSLPKGGWTNYAAVFDWLAQAVPRDYDRLSAQFRVKRPAVYFITDGQPVVEGVAQPDELWKAPLKALHDHSSKPIVTALGLGEAVERTLCDVRSSPGQAWVASPEAVPGQLLGAIIDQIIKSVVQSSSGDDFVFETPRGMRRVEC
jgi:uncharacterized protein YegL